MRLEKVDLNLFVLFDAIYREGSVTKVAQRLNLTQPAVSNALSRLRQTFDDPLFVRTPSGMVPTPVAESVIGDVRKALTLLGKSVGAAASFDPKTAEKQFCIGMNDLAQTLLLAPLRKLLRDQAPNSSLHTYYVDRQTAADDLKSGNLDVVLDSPGLFNAREMGSKNLAQLPYVVAMGDQCSLNSKKVSLEDYLSAEHLHVSSRRKGRGQVDIALHGLGYKRKIKMRVQGYLVAERLTESTDLVWTVPEILAQQANLKTAALPFEVEPLGWSLFWHKSAADDPANQWLRSVVSDIVSAAIS
ncbi:LysR family transcriptional regulator [Maricurvus nonylphenolicus]